MPRSSRTKEAATRASFGRAERLQREKADSTSGKPAPSRQRDAAPRADRAQQQEGKKARTERTPTENVTRAAARERKLTALNVAVTRAERARDASDRRQQQRFREQTRDAFNGKAERRQETEQRAEHDRKQKSVQTALKRTDDARRKQTQRQTTRKRDEMRRAFAREASNRHTAALAVRQKEMERRATAQIEQEQKRRVADQQTEHRRQTSEVRGRHKNELHAYRSNEDAAMARHHNAIKGVDQREADKLHDFDGRRRGLAGRIAECVPGKRVENDRQREQITKGFEAERLTKHRDYEALKERQFEVAQRGRLQQAQERKALMELHRDDRTNMQQDHAKDRPGLVERRTRVLDRVDREQAHERDRERPEPGRDANRVTDRPAIPFPGTSAKADTRPESNAGSAIKEVERHEPERPAPSRDVDRAFERFFNSGPM